MISRNTLAERQQLKTQRIFKTLCKLASHRLPQSVQQIHRCLEEAFETCERTTRRDLEFLKTMELVEVGCDYSGHAVFEVNWRNPLLASIARSTASSFPANART